MDKIDIEGLILTPLNRIHNPNGDILHGIKRSEAEFSSFGEAYFSMIKNGSIKGWNKHKVMTLNLIVAIGEVSFVVYDDREASNTNGSFYKIELSQLNYKRLTVPPGLWLAFKGKGNQSNLILNIASIEHDSEEIERKPLEQINYNWQSV